MELETDRLVLRRWTEGDAEDLFAYASDPDVGPIAGWPPHQSVEESRGVIRDVLCGKECYAVCLKGDRRAIGAIELMLASNCDRVEREDECELGYWIAKPFWGQGLIPEAAGEVIRHAFEDLGMRAIWCGYYEGNFRSKRVQEKVGFTYHHTCSEAPVPLLGEVRVEQVNLLTREGWQRA